MTINNLELIKPLIRWDDPHDFYFVQILKRRKENPDMPSGDAVVIATYFVNSMKRLEKLFPEMALLAKFHKARIYINLNRRNSEQLGLQMIKKITDYLINKTYGEIKNAYISTCGSFHAEKPAKWLVDTDNYTPEQLQTTKNIILELGGTVYGDIPTVFGMHLITSSFNVVEFSKKHKSIGVAATTPDIQKNSPTLLYYSDEGIK